MKRCTLDTNIITAFLKNDLRVVQRVSDLVLITNNIKHFKRVKDLRIDNWIEN